jgi:hypothetical protein
MTTLSKVMKRIWVMLNKRERKSIGHMKVQKHSKKEEEREKKRKIAHIQEKE